MKTFLLIVVFVLAGCSTTSRKKQSQLSQEVSAFFSPGKYDVTIYDDSAATITTRVTVVNDAGTLVFQNADPATGLNDFSLNLDDSAVFVPSRTYYKNRLVVSAANSGIGKEFLGYGFQLKPLGAFSEIEMFEPLFEDWDEPLENTVFIIGKIKTGNDVVIRFIRRTTLRKKIIRDVNRTYVLKRNLLAQ